MNGCWLDVQNPAIARARLAACLFNQKGLVGGVVVGGGGGGGVYYGIVGANVSK